MSPLVLGPSGGLLSGPTGLPASSTTCCCCKYGVDCAHCACCQCQECGDGTRYSLPTNGCHNASGNYCLTVTLSGLTFHTACRTYRGNDCAAAPGTFAAYKLLSASLPADLVMPFNWNDGALSAIRDPDSPCSDIANVCRQWRVCQSLMDTGIDFTQYANSNCSGASNTANVVIAQAVLDYQVVGTTRRFVLWVTIGVSSAIPIPIFFGTASFDARQCANYSSWPLVINNGLASTACACGGSNTAFHPAATGGTATLTLACDNPSCGGAGPMGGGSLPTAAIRGDVEGAARLIARADASSSLAPARKGCCV